MIRYSVLFLLLFINNCFFSQRSEVVFQSKASHNYAIGKLFYVEDVIDTSRLMHMATLKITSSNQDVFVSKAHNLLEIKTKELNANSYKLKSFSLVDTTLIMFFDVYFAPEKQIELIEKNRILGKLILFNNIKDTIYRNVCVGDSCVVFSRKKYLSISASTNKKDISLRLVKRKDALEILTKTINKENAAFFYTVKLRDDSQSVPVMLGGALGGVLGALIVAETMQLMNKNTDPEYDRFSRLSYNLGRTLIAIYPLDKQISLN
ncbi:MAG TPA: hypothetical protein PKZ75_09725 [Bacteroidia bacterium]|nr:hypothetical protein [Bacteroidia bacterium]